MDTKTKEILRDKLLSHRLRGFSSVENSASAAQKAFASNIKHFEIDTRCDSDGQIYVHHDPAVIYDNKKIYFCKETIQSPDNIRYKTGEPILSFNTLLEYFKNRALKEQMLYIDIKDYGFEENHLSAIRSFDLEKHTAFVSWIPQTLLKLHEQGTCAPLFLSHVNLYKYGVWGKLMATVLKNSIFRFSRQIVVGGNKATSDPGTLAVGYEHQLVCTELPEPYPEILALNNGGVCISRRFLCDRIIDYCEKYRLKLLIFSVGDTAGFMKYASVDGVSAVFCDNAPAVEADLFTTKDTTTTKGR